MATIFYGLNILVLLIHALGGTLLFRKWLGGVSDQLAMLFGVVSVVGGLFFVEHFVGLGSLGWVWPLSLLLSVWMIWQSRYETTRMMAGQCWFWVGFLMSFVWRYQFPDITQHSEKLMDYTLIRAFMQGDRLPPIDPWLPPYAVDFYYVLQFYAAGLLGRVFQWDAGFTYQMAVCVIIGLTMNALAGWISKWLPKRGMATLVLLTILLGGTGATPFMHLLREEAAPVHSVRFIGRALTKAKENRPLGDWVVEKSGGQTEQSLELPAETFSYLLSLGDYHPPLAGYLLLAVALLGFSQIGHWGGALMLGASVPLCVAGNAWTFPLQGLLVVFLVGLGWYSKRWIHWKGLGLGFFGGWVMVLPFLSYFAVRSGGYGDGLSLVEASKHTPWILWLILFWPFLVLILLSFFSAKGERVVKWTALFWLVLLVFSEVVFFDDIYEGKNQRFNTTLKWWPWMMMGMVGTLGAMNLASARALCRFGSMAMLVVLCSYVVDLQDALTSKKAEHRGRLDGTAWLEKEPSWKPVLTYLKTQKRGVVLQNISKQSYTESPAITMFAGHISVLGWTGHENLWRNFQKDIEVRRIQVRQFYRGELTDKVDWLLSMDVDYIVNLHRDIESEEVFQKITKEISSHYVWQPLSWSSEGHSGIWKRRE